MDPIRQVYAEFLKHAMEKFRVSDTPLELAKAANAPID